MMSFIFWFCWIVPIFWLPPCRPISKSWNLSSLYKIWETEDDYNFGKLKEKWETYLGMFVFSFSLLPTLLNSFFSARNTMEEQLHCTWNNEVCNNSKNKVFMCEIWVPIRRQHFERFSRLLFINFWGKLLSHPSWVSVWVGLLEIKNCFMY